MSLSPEPDGPATASTLVMPQLVPSQRVAGRYVLQEIIGRGGMGIVWRAYDEKLARSIALKLLPDAVAHDEAALDALKAETRHSLKLTHPNIVRIHDFIDDDQVAAISMELVEGANLSQLRRHRASGHFEAADLQDWVVQLTDALEYAHQSCRVVHRDLKPGNLLIAQSGELKLADFGIAHSISDSIHRLTGVQPVSGTLAYMSPQQLDGKAAQVTDDIYSLGATLYDLLAGSPPFHSGDVGSQIRHQRPTSIAERRLESGLTGSAVPDRWEATIAACLEKNPEGRPRTAAEVRARLLQADGHPVPVRSENHRSAAPQATPSARRKKGWAVAAAGVAGLTLLLAWGAGLQSRRAGTVLPVDSPPPLRSVPARSSPWTNSLGQVFIPIKGTGVWFSQHETRRREFAAFVQATGHEATTLVSSMRENGWALAGDSWENLAPTPEHPAAGISWDDANAFCQWLTTKERSEGRLGSDEFYRLPADAEWSVAEGKGPYLWGAGYPPSTVLENFCGEEPKDDQWMKGYRELKGYADGFARAAPVGSFKPNPHGLYDLGGNVLEYCDDWYRRDLNPPALLAALPQLAEDGGGRKYRLLRGASWADFGSGGNFLVGARGRTWPHHRFDNRGFRCVLVPSAGVTRDAGPPAAKAAAPPS
jgi:serine/threonine protein kinase